MKYNITDALSNETTESKIELISYLLERAKNKKSNDIYSSEIDSYISQKEIFSDNPYCIIGPKYALGCLTGNFLYHIVKVKETQTQITLLEDLLIKVKGFGPESNPLLKKTTTKKLISILTDQNINKAFLNEYGLPLRLYYIPFAHKEVNAYYYPWLHSIGSFKPKNDCGTPEYIFMHEIGHLVAHRITGDPDKIPNSFIEFNNKFHPGFKGNLVEAFADLFAIAAMIDTEFASYRPAIEIFDSQDLKEIKNYFTTLANTELANVKMKRPFIPELITSIRL